MIIDALLRALGKAGHEFNWQFLGLAAFLAFVIFCIHRIVKFLDSGRKEQKLMRMELSKLAEEVSIISKKLENLEANDEKADTQ